MLMQKVVFITGVSSGFGNCISKKLINEGHIVYGTYRKNVVAIDKLNLIQLDVTDRLSVNSAINKIIKEQGRIDVLINNAGMGYYGPIAEFTSEEIHEQMNTNFYGFVYTVQAVLPHMRQQNSGIIINISSLGGIMGLPYQAFYSASKFAIEGFSEALAIEELHNNIRVIVIRPGDFRTNFTQNRKSIQKLYQNHERIQQPFLKTFEVIKNDELNGLSPEILANKIVKIIRKKRPRFAYVIASFEQKLAVFLKNFLPNYLFFNILSKHYKIK